MGCMRTWETRVVNNITHLIVLFCERYWLAGVAGQVQLWTKSGVGRESYLQRWWILRQNLYAVDEHPPCCLLDFCVLLPVLKWRLLPVLDSKLRIQVAVGGIWCVQEVGNYHGGRTKMRLLRVEFLLKTESGCLRDAEVTWFTLANP